MGIPKLSNSLISRHPPRHNQEPVLLHSNHDRLMDGQFAGVVDGDASGVFPDLQDAVLDRDGPIPAAIGKVGEELIDWQGVKADDHIEPVQVPGIAGEV